MNDSVKVAGLCMSGVLSFSFAAIGEPVVSKTFFGIFCGLLGLPVVGAGIKKLTK